MSLTYGIGRPTVRVPRIETQLCLNGVIRYAWLAVRVGGLRHNWTLWL